MILYLFRRDSGVVFEKFAEGFGDGIEVGLEPGVLGVGIECCGLWRLSLFLSHRLSHLV